MAGDAFVDTNVLLYAAHEGNARYAAATALLRVEVAAGTVLWISRQVMREYLAVVTRPQPDRAPVSAVEATADMRRLEQEFAVAEDGPDVTLQLCRLIERFPTGGRQVHDANIVATMLAHGIPRLLTFNMADLRRFASVVALEPTEP
ncbi:MAG TPA: PIN domain-containing protein [Geminicoccaceae bacterium]|nr:PIN domain-containing protein [Geminicoccaceae bacterium]